MEAGRRAHEAQHIRRAFQSPILKLSRHCLAARIGRALDAGLDFELPLTPGPAEGGEDGGRGGTRKSNANSHAASWRDPGSWRAAWRRRAAEPQAPGAAAKAAVPQLFGFGALEPHISTALRSPVVSRRLQSDHATTIAATPPLRLGGADGVKQIGRKYKVRLWRLFLQ